MSKKHKNPYKRGTYFDLFAFVKKKQVVTLIDVVNEAMRLGLDENKAWFTTRVLMSPRHADQCKGKPQGSCSAQGHVYYMEKLARRIVNGVKEAQRYRLRWRDPELPPLKHPVAIKEKVEGKATKETKATKATKAKAKKGKKAKVAKFRRLVSAIGQVESELGIVFER